MDVKNLVSKYALQKPVTRALVELINEIFYSFEVETEEILDILDTETMSEEFLIDWITFYGATITQTENGTIDRNVLRRYRAILKKRGELASIRYMIQSGGGLFLTTPVSCEIYTWYDVPADLCAEPEDGIIYLRTSDKRVVVESDMIGKVTPAGYKYDLYFSYYGELLIATPKILNLQIVQYQERGVDAEPSISGGLGDSWITRFVNTNGATFTERWSFTSAFKNGLTFTEMMNIPFWRYGGVYKQNGNIRETFVEFIIQATKDYHDSIERESEQQAQPTITNGVVKYYDISSKEERAQFTERWSFTSATKNGLTIAQMCNFKKEMYSGVYRRILSVDRPTVGVIFTPDVSGEINQDITSSEIITEVYQVSGKLDTGTDGKVVQQTTAVGDKNSTSGSPPIDEEYLIGYNKAIYVDRSSGQEYASTNDKLLVKERSVEQVTEVSGDRVNVRDNDTTVINQKYTIFTPYWTVASLFKAGSTLMDVQPGQTSVYRTQTS